MYFCVMSHSERMQAIATRIRELRKERDWDRLDLSIHSRVGEAVIQRLEAVADNVEMITLSRIAEAFQVDIEALWR